jgi:hypothetical protein
MVQLAFLAPSIKADTTAIEQAADEADPEKVVYRVDGTISTGHGKSFAYSSGAYSHGEGSQTHRVQTI